MSNTSAPTIAPTTVCFNLSVNDRNASATTTEDLAYSVTINVLLFLLVFGLAGTVDFDVFRERLKEKKGIAIGLLLQFLLLPFIGFVVVMLLGGFFSVETLLAQILVITVSSPGGSYSNWWCSLINADLALSVAMTTVNTILSMAFLPLNIYLYAGLAVPAFFGRDPSDVELPWTSIATTMGIVISAILLGLYAGYRKPEWQTKLNIVGQTCGFASIIFGLVYSNTGGETSNVFSKPAQYYVSVGLPCAFALALSFFLASLARLPKPQRTAVAIEVSYQNTSIALAVAVNIGGACGREAAAIPTLYGMGEVLLIGTFAILAWRAGWTYSPTNEWPWKVAFYSYQDAAKEELLAKDGLNNSRVGGSVDPSETKKIVNSPSQSNFAVTNPSGAGLDSPQKVTEAQVDRVI